MPSFQLHAASLLVVAVAACSGRAESKTTFSPPPSTASADGTIRISENSRPYVVVRPATRETSAPVVRAPARVAFRDGAVSQLNLPVSGRVAIVHVKTGDRVKVGDPLVTLSSPEAASARASLAAAQAEHEAATREVARQDQMSSSGVGIESERVGAQARLRQIEAELARAQTTMAMFGGSGGAGSVVVLRAPIEGTVIARRVTVGSVAQPGGEPLIEIGNPDALWIVADVFERDLVQVHEGAEVDVELSTDRDALRGTVVSIGSALTGSTRTAPVYIALHDSARELRAGMFARAAIKATAGQSIVLPSESVLVKDGKKSIVYVKRGEDRFAPCEVTIGRSLDGKVQVLSGVAAGDQVVVKGALLIDGAADQLL